MNWERDEEQEEANLAAAEAMDAELDTGLENKNPDNPVQDLLQTILNPEDIQQPRPGVTINKQAVFQDRIELVNLYQALLSQSLFGEGGNNRLKAVVEQEIRDFVVARLETLLGMNKPKPTVSDSFNQNEIKALKMLASKITTKGFPTTATTIAPQLNPVNVTSEAIVQPASPPDTVTPVSTQKKRGRGRPKKNRAPIVDPATGKKRPNPVNVGQVRGPKGLPMPNEGQEAAKIISEITNRPKGKAGALDLAIAKSINNAKERE